MGETVCGAGNDGIVTLPLSCPFSFISFSITRPRRLTVERVPRHKLQLQTALHLNASKGNHLAGARTVQISTLKETTMRSKRHERATGWRGTKSIFRQAQSSDAICGKFMSFVAARHKCTITL